MFTVIRYQAARSPIGTSFTFNNTIAGLCKQGSIVSITGQYSMRFPYLPDRGWWQGGRAARFLRVPS